MKKLVATSITIIFLSICLVSASAFGISIESSSEKSTSLVNNNEGTLIIKVIGKFGTPVKEKVKVTAQFCNPDSWIPFGDNFELPYANPVPGCDCDGHYMKDFIGRAVIIYVSVDDYTLGPHGFKIKDECQIERIRLTKSVLLTSYLPLLNQILKLIKH